MSATATREVESGEMEEDAKQWIMDWRRSGRMRQDEEDKEDKVEKEEEEGDGNR